MLDKQTTFVVYFDQQSHACACVRMVENDHKHKKMMKKVYFPSCVQEAHVFLHAPYMSLSYS